MKRIAKRISQCFLASLVLVMMFGMTSQAAVKKVTITAPTKNKTYTVYRTTKNVKKQIKASVKVTKKKDSKALTYKSSNPSVVSVTSKGKITCKKAGTATITVASKQNPKVKDTIKIKVVQRATKLTASTNGYTIKKSLTVTKGKSVKVAITAAPADASNKVTWKSSKSSVAKVDKNGKITAKKAGTATITATAKDGSKKKVSFKVKVVTGKVSKITVDKTEVALVVGGTSAEATATVKATVKTSGKKASKVVGWTTSNKKVATVKNGKITAVAEGTATITVKATDGSNKKATVKVTVTKKEEPKKEEPKKDPAPNPTPGATTYTKKLEANVGALTNGFTVKSSKSIKWTDGNKALSALNNATKDIEKHLPSKIKTGSTVVVNGQSYTLKYTAEGWVLLNKNNQKVDIANKLLSSNVGDVTISNKATADQVKTALEKVYAGKVLLTGPYDFGTGTITVDKQTFVVSKFVVKNGAVEAVIDGANVTIVMDSTTTITVTSDKPLDSIMTAVEAMFNGVYTVK